MEKSHLREQCCGVSATMCFAAGAAADWQLERLMRPTAAQLAAEVDGRIVIYDGLDAQLASQAMDAGFERIQNMMFIRIHHLLPPGADGEAFVEDGDCD